MSIIMSIQRHPAFCQVECLARDVLKEHTPEAFTRSTTFSESKLTLELYRFLAVKQLVLRTGRSESEEDSLQVSPGFLIDALWHAVLLESEVSLYCSCRSGAVVKKVQCNKATVAEGVQHGRFASSAPCLAYRPVRRAAGSSTHSTACTCWLLHNVRVSVQINAMCALTVLCPARVLQDREFVDVLLPVCVLQARVALDALLGGHVPHSAADARYLTDEEKLARQLTALNLMALEGWTPDLFFWQQPGTAMHKVGAQVPFGAATASSSFGCP
jgi:hypothetical protein